MDAISMFKLESILINLICEKMGISQDNDYNLIYKDRILNWDDNVYIGFDTINVEFRKEHTTMSCDGVIFFGDGTIELHDAEMLDAFNWSNFTNDSLKKVISTLK